MTEHRIRLRGGWKWQFDEPVADRPLELPFDWPAGLCREIRLTRQFGRVRHDPVSESIRLEMLDVPGLSWVTLNGKELAIPDQVGRVELVEPLQHRNQLILHIELKEGPILGWGAIALVIATR